MNTKYKFNPEMYKVVQKNIKKYRLTQGMSLKELSKYSNIKLKYLEKLEDLNSNCTISINDLYKISVILGVSIDKFFQE